MNEFLTNPWLFLTVVIWLICGIVTVMKKDNVSIFFAFVASISIGVLYMIVHGH